MATKLYVAKSGLKLGEVTAEGLVTDNKILREVYNGIITDQHQSISGRKIGEEIFDELVSYTVGREELAEIGRQLFWSGYDVTT